ncbi:hypothetical protein [Nocardia crassostreae]|uniref:hypothetical protein n=1 Tax=Nocardia crassostreae TaxID=53428 RepID=UPI0008352322|nr:hypothetical protein [Nocardia crassostreae]
MTEQHRYPTDADEAQQFMDKLTFDDTTRAPELPATGAPVTVSRTVRLPLDLNQRIRDEAVARGVTDSDVIREWIAIGAANAQWPDDTELVSRAAAERAVMAALATLHAERRPA